MAKRLLLLNGIAIFCVILFHATGFGFTAMFSWAHRYRPVTSPNYDQIGTAAYYVLRVVEQFVVFCIPAFLFVSGYFVSVLAGRSRALEPRAVVAKVRNLLWPYLVWSTVVLVGLALQGRILSETQYLRHLVTGSSNPNFYYVPILIQLYVLAPAIVLLARWRWRALLAVSAAVQIAVYAVQYPIVLGVDAPAVRALGALLPKYFFLVHLFWFTFGVVAGLQTQRFRQVLERARPWLPVAVVALFALGLVEWELLLRWSGGPWTENRITLVDGIYAGAVLLSFLAFAELELPFSSALVALGARSYGIYLVHGLVMEYFSRGLYHFAPWVLSQQIVFQPLLIALGLSVPLLLMLAVSRSPSRNLYGYLFG
jgi:surface polysaccharide O-acyltransferase-like enzyme